MDLITMEKLKEILAISSDWCVSVYMPTHRMGREMEQDPIRLKNLLKDVENRLLAKGLRLPDVREGLEKPLQLLQDGPFWQHQSDGLALFFTKEYFCFFRLPVNFAETTVITDRFHTKPLLPILTSDGAFHILAISQNRIRLLEGTQHTVQEIELGEVPKTLSETLPEELLKRHKQFHTGTASRGGAVGRAAISHSQDPSDDLKIHISSWFRTIDKTVATLLSDTKCPLVLAGVDSLFPLYKEVNSYPYLLDNGIPGNPDVMQAEELHSKAWAIVEPVFNKEREDATALYRQLAGTGRTTTDVAAAVLAAHHGQVAMIFVAVGVQVWGKVDLEKNLVELDETAQLGDEDLLDSAAIQTLIKGGDVFVVSQEDVPGKGFLAAVLRH